MRGGRICLEERSARAGDELRMVGDQVEGGIEADGHLAKPDYEQQGQDGMGDACFQS